MVEQSPFESELKAALEAYVGPRRSVDAGATARAAIAPAPRGPSWRIVRIPASPWPAVRWPAVAAILVVLAALLASTLAVGGVNRDSQRHGVAAITPAGNGLVAFGSDGDVFVGDLATGLAAPIVAGPVSSALFSPDGTRIAFVRGDGWTADVAILTVRPDGSDERIVMPTGYSRGELGFSWTPDGGSLLIHHDGDTDGVLSLVDGSGASAPRLVSPPLPAAPGGPYGLGGQVAPMVRPPAGHQILTTDVGTELDAKQGQAESLYLWDTDLTARTEISVDGLEQYDPYYFAPWSLYWSPDGSMIAFSVGTFGQQPLSGFFVARADGTGLRHFESDGGGLRWSPDGRTIAHERCTSGRDGDTNVIVLVDLASGSERVLEATRVLTKTEGSVPSPTGTEPPFCGWYQGPRGRVWDYEGWSWSRDGSSIVFLERRGGRPTVVDAKTGQVTGYLWASDSMPTWSRSATIER